MTAEEFERLKAIERYLAYMRKKYFEDAPAPSKSKSNGP